MPTNQIATFASVLHQSSQHGHRSINILLKERVIISLHQILLAIIEEIRFVSIYVLDTRVIDMREHMQV